MKISTSLAKLIAARFRKRMYLMLKNMFNIEEIEWKPDPDSPLFSARNNVILPFDWVIGARTLAYGHWHDEQLSLIRNIQKAKKHKMYFFVDVGANAGLVTRQLIGIDDDEIWAGAVCFEPESRNFSRLVRNTAHLKNVTTYKYGISSEGKTMPLNIDSGNSGDYSLDELPNIKNRAPINQEYVEIISSDRAWDIIGKHNNYMYPIVWKSDTQGHDLRIISSLPKESWGSIEIAMIEVCSRSSTDAEISTFIEFISEFKFLRKIKHGSIKISIQELEEFCRKKSKSEFDILVWR